MDKTEKTLKITRISQYKHKSLPLLALQISGLDKNGDGFECFSGYSDVDLTARLYRSVMVGDVVQFTGQLEFWMRYSTPKAVKRTLGIHIQSFELIQSVADTPDKYTDRYSKSKLFSEFVPGSD